MRVFAILLGLAACKPADLDTEPGTDTPVDLDGDGWAAPEDCDDADPEVHPGATERCDGVDQDCDGAVDEYTEEVRYIDADGDGFAGTPAADCGGALTAEDCDDAEPGTYPGAPEGSLCEPRDRDCDGHPGGPGEAVVGGVMYATLNDAVAAAPPKGVVEICPGQHAASIVLEDRELSLTSWDKADPAVLVTQADSWAIVDAYSSDVVLTDLVFDGSLGPPALAVITAFGSLAVERVSFLQFQFGVDAAAMYINPGPGEGALGFSMKHSSVEGSIGVDRGLPAVLVKYRKTMDNSGYGRIELENNSFVNNTCTALDILGWDSTLEVNVRDSVFASNVGCSGSPGALALGFRRADGQISLSGNTFESNEGLTYPGAIYLYAEGGGNVTLDIANSVFTGNTSDGAAVLRANGGYHDDTEVTYFSLRLSEVSVRESEGKDSTIAIHSLDGAVVAVDVKDSQFADNVSADGLGVLDLRNGYGPMTVSITNSAFTGNEGDSGTIGVYSGTGEGSATVTTSTFESNEVLHGPDDTKYGRILWPYGVPASVSDTSFYRNTGGMKGVIDYLGSRGVQLDAVDFGTGSDENAGADISGCDVTGVVSGTMFPPNSPCPK